MAQPHDLHELIQALSPAEKRHFKVYASLHAKKKSNYEQLFDALNNWKTDYDEVAFKQKHKGKPFLKNLAEEKSHLRELILKVMRTAEIETSLEQTLYSLLFDIEFFRKKGLNTQLRETINKARDHATFYQMYSGLMMLLDVEYFTTSTDFNDFRYSVEQINKMEEELVGKISLTRRVNMLQRFYSEIRNNRSWVKHQAEISEWIKEVDKILSQTELPYTVVKQLIRSKGLYLFDKGDVEGSASLNKFAIEHYEPFLKDYPTVGNIQRSAIFIFNYIADLITLKRFDEIPAYILKLKELYKFKLTYKFQHLWLFHLTTTAEMYYTQHIPNHKECIRLTNIATDGLEKFGKIMKPDQRITMYQNIVIMHFYHKMFTTAIDYIQLFFEHCYRTERANQRNALMRSFEVMCHICMGNFVLAGNLTRNVKRFYHEHGLISPFFEAYFSLLNDIVKEGKIRTSSFEKWISHLAVTAQRHDENSMLDYVKFMILV